MGEKKLIWNKMSASARDLHTIPDHIVRDHRVRLFCVALQGLWKDTIHTVAFGTDTLWTGVEENLCGYKQGPCI